MPIVPIVVVIWIIAIAYFISHGIYRAVVGTKCAFKGIDPPWVASRQEKLTAREIRRGRRREVYGSPRTARGFVARLWGDGWEFANKVIDDLGKHDDAQNPGGMDTPAAPGVKPVEIVPADAGASWVRQLGDKAVKTWGRARNLWDRWWLPSRRRCPWMYLTDERCGQAVKAKDATYCPEHQELHELGHCLKVKPDGTECTRPREDHYLFCTQHMDEVDAKQARPAAGEMPATPEAPEVGTIPAPAAAAQQPEAPQVGTLDTPDTPELAATSAASATEMTDEQRQLAAKIKDAWLRGELVEPDPTYAEWFALPVSVRAELLKAAEDGGIRLDTTFDPDARTHAGLPIGWRTTDQPAARPATGEARCWWGRPGVPQFPGQPDTGQPHCEQPAEHRWALYCTPHADQMQAWNEEQRQAREEQQRAAARQPDEPLCQWGRGATSESPDHGQPPCMEHAVAHGIHCVPHETEYGEWRAHAAAQQPPAPAEPEPEPEAPPQQPVLRLVPNTNTQGDTSMTTPAPQATGEMTNTQGLADYAASLRDYGTRDWPANIQEGLTQVTNAKLSNDPDIAAAFGELTQISHTVAAVADKIDAALANGHNQATDAISGLGDRAADTAAYKRN